MNENKKKYLEALGCERIAVAACHPWFVEDAMEAMNEGPDEDDEFYHTRSGFMFSGFVSRPAELVDTLGIDIPSYYFDVFEEVEIFGLEDSAYILTRKNCYWNDDDCDEEDKCQEREVNAFGQCAVGQDFCLKQIVNRDGDEQHEGYGDAQSEAGLYSLGYCKIRAHTQEESENHVVHKDRANEQTNEMFHNLFFLL